MTTVTHEFGTVEYFAAQFRSYDDPYPAFAGAVDAIVDPEIGRGATVRLEHVRNAVAALDLVLAESGR